MERTVNSLQRINRLNCIDIPVYIPGRDGVIKCADLAVKNDVVFSGEVGVFASRARLKVNRIGISLARLSDIQVQIFRHFWRLIT